jgi:predicted nucleotidyltransferase
VSGRPSPVGGLDPPADRYLRACVGVLQRLLGDNLIGAYLYSSAVMGDYIPGRSDLDVVVVVADRLDTGPALALARQLCAVATPFPTKGLDLTVVTLESVRSEWRFPRVELKLLTFFGEPHTADDEPEGDTRVVMHFACCRDHGIPLVGPPAGEVFAPVSRREYLMALGRELNRVWMTPHYTILNACRDLRFVEEGVICSKVAGGQWALERGHDRWLLEAALGWQLHGIGPVIDGVTVDEFVTTIASRLTIALDAPGPIRPVAGVGPTPPPASLADPLEALVAQPERFQLSPHETPLVSCVLLATDDRAATVRSVRWFGAQDYQARELIIVAPWYVLSELQAVFVGDPQIRMVASPRPGDVGIERDAGCRHARGELFALWEQDTWYAPWRLSYQVGALLRTSYDTSAATAVITWDPVVDECWPERSTPSVGHRQLVAATVCLTRAAWKSLPFALRSTAEPLDPGLLDAAPAAVHVPRGAHFAVVVKPGGYLTGVQPVRYPPETVEALLGPAARAFIGGPVDVPAPVPPVPPVDPAQPALIVEPSDEPPLALPAFGPDAAELIPRAEDVTIPLPLQLSTRRWVAGSAAPMVSCIMPTFNRRRFIAQTLRNLMRQDYPNVELVVIDDGTEPVADLLADVPGCTYIRLDERVTIGHKRNLACEAARGEIVVQWDDDDWYGAHRVSRQVMEIVNGNADATGIGVNLLLDVRSMQVWSTREREAADPLFASIEAVAGGTLAYAKNVWRQVGGYPNASLGEDVGLLQLIADAGARIAPMSNQGAYVYIRHGRNSWRYDFDPELGPPGWNRSQPPATMEPADLAFYASLQRGSGIPIGPRTV